MIKTTIPIKGMHCRSCEILVGEKLQEFKNIIKVNVSFREKTAKIYSENPLNIDLISDAIKETGYEIGEEKPKEWINKNINHYADLSIAILVLSVLFVIGSSLGLFNINVSNGSPESLVVVLLIGLTAGVSTCMALVGGLVLGISARHAEKHPEATAIQKFRPHLYFNIGRIISYFVFGGLIALIGKVFQFSGQTLGILTIVVGIVMLVLGFKLVELFPRLSNASLSLPPSINHLLGIKKHHEKEYSHVNSMFVGGLTFFLPCGFTQAMQLYAMSTGNFLSGALIMAVFALGTAPGLLSIGGLTSLMKGAFARIFFKFAGIIVIVLSVFNISNGYNLTGWTLGFGAESSVAGQDTNIIMENGVQIANMKQTYSGYVPNTFIVKENIPVKWIIDGEALNSCSASLSVPKLNIFTNLKLGENVIEFTPTDTGIIKFTCAMGMYPGEFIVVENEDYVPGTETPGTKITTPEGESSQTITVPEKTDISSFDEDEIQVLKTTYVSNYTDISPNSFTVKANQPVRFEIDVQENGYGCMSTIMIPGLYNYPEFLEAGKKIVMEFIPDQKGTYSITCAMGVPRGSITVL